MTRRKKRYKPEPVRRFVKRGDAELVRKAIAQGWATPRQNQKPIIEDIVEMGLHGCPRKSLAAFKVVLEIQKLEFEFLKSLSH